MQPDPDRNLVEAAARGDREAFGVLVSRYQARIVTLARSMTGEAGESEDLAQETFIRAYKSIGRFRGDSAFRTWLHRVAVNVIQSHLKSRSRRWWLWGSAIDEHAGDGRRDAPAPGAAAGIEERVARRQIIDRALASLAPDLRMAVTLRDIEGFEYAEIADILGVPIGTVESRIFRARQRLRPMLAPLIDGGSIG